MSDDPRTQELQHLLNAVAQGGTDAFLAGEKELVYYTDQWSPEEQEQLRDALREQVPAMKARIRDGAISNTRTIPGPFTRTLTPVVEEWRWLE